MKKRELIKKSSISKNEYQLLEKLKKAGVEMFTTRQALKTTNWNQRKIHQTLSRLAQKNIINRIKRGEYTIKDMNRIGIEEMVQKTVWPSYISHWSALSRQHLTEQLPRTIFITTTRKSGETVIQGFKVKYVKVEPYRFFGYEKKGELVVAEKEKALVESLMQPKYSGGVSEAAKCLKEAWHAVNQDKLVEYALRMRNKTLIKRLGYLIEVTGLKASVKTLSRLALNTGLGYSRLDPQKPKKGAYSKKWGLIVNTEVLW